MGVCIIRIITRKGADELVNALRIKGYGVTVLDARGNSGPVAVFYSVIHRADIPCYVETINTYNSKAFYSIEDVRLVNSGVFPVHRRVVARPLRKGK